MDNKWLGLYSANVYPFPIYGLPILGTKCPQRDAVRFELLAKVVLIYCETSFTKFLMEKKVGVLRTKKMIDGKHNVILQLSIKNIDGILSKRLKMKS